MHLDEPSLAMGIGINFLGRIVQVGIGLDDFAGYRCVDFADRFYGFDGAKRFTGSDLRARKNCA